MRLWTVLLATTLAFASVRASDIDGDGHLDAADCDDRDASAWSLPGEPTNLHFVSKTTFLWDAAADIGATAATFVTVRSTSPSNFAAAPASCADPEGLTASTTDASVPPLGTAFYYLVRARNACGDGLLGHRSNGAVTPGLACDCSVICDDAQACTRDRCADGICAHDPLATVIADQPDDVAVCPGGSATFRVRGAPDGAGPHYQWKKNGVAVGTDSPTLTLTGLAPGDDNVQITAVVSGACAPTTSSTAILTVFPSAISCSGGGNGYEAPNGATSIVSLGDPDAPTSGRMRDYGRVQLATGEYVIEDVDLSIEGRGFDFVWKRTYRSRTGSLTPMGYNWDFSYNRRIEVSTTGITLHAGNGRADVYAPSTTGCYVSPGFFRELCPQADGSWVLTFADRTTWRFAALDGSPTQGRIVEAQDTDANTMSFAYDSTGKLQTITDTLGRPVTIAYTAGGYVSSITDFAGRQVVYQSCSAVDPTCMPGDLASVTSPPITGTPNGNDLPEGRKTLYTYAAYTGDPALDHNLNTVGKWFRLDNNAEPQVIVHNVYSGADRLEKQVYGDDPFTSVSYVYATPPAAEEPGAATKTIVRDRVGNVGEVYFDASNRAVAVRRYTGRAPSLTLPTGVTTSRPGAPLRATDPPYFRTTFAWNEDSLLTQATFPKLDTVGFTYDSAVTNNMRIRANALEARRTAGPAGGDQTLLHAQWTYAPDWGTEPQGLCVEVDGGVWPLDPVDFTTVSAKEWFEILVKKDVDLVGLEARWVTYTDPNGRAYTQTVDPTTGHVTSRTAPPVSIGQPAGTVQSITESWAYNTHGQVIGHTDPKGHVTQATYYSSGPATGYLESVTVDAPAGTPGALALLTVTARDAFGNATALTDPNGHTRTFAYNQLDELVRYVTPSPSSYTTDLRYDAAGRLSRIDRDNRDETGAFRYRPKEFTGLSFDALDRPTSLTVDGPGALDPNGGLNLRSEVSYDGNGWATLVRRRNAVAGTQPHETTRILYDERALPYRVVEAEGDAAQSTVQLDYDLDGGVAAVREGLEASP
ncbi:MAG TPA: DUF6531 domain-containing protein, partial [Candidatus Polarisedimenticolaceae bacterium]|nr:DUF6531 domain-containing protein [Candidatus Polarisedimenticolaceae bacterium]